jgi:hypothetical protein
VRRPWHPAPVTGFGTKRPPVQIRPPRPMSRTTALNPKLMVRNRPPLDVRGEGAHGWPQRIAHDTNHRGTKLNRPCERGHGHVPPLLVDTRLSLLVASSRQA